MCLLIEQPRGVSFSKADLRDYLDYNGDGCGFAYADRGRLITRHFLNADADAIKYYHREIAGRPGLLHFRMATHGSKSVENCHPFLLTPEIAFAHNGILNMPDHATKSDTRLFGEMFLTPIACMTPDVLFSPAFAATLGKLIGSSNRMMFIHADGRCAVVNRDMGTTHKRAWLSNTYAWSSPDNADAWLRDFRHYRRTNGVTHVSAARVLSVADGTGTGAVPTWVTTDDPDDGLEGADSAAAEELGDGLADALEDVAQSYADSGTTGVREWAHANPDAAEALLNAWYNFTPGQVNAMLVDAPEALVSWLCEIVEAH